MSTGMSLLGLPMEILFSIIKPLDRPARLALGLTGPEFLSIMACYYDLDRYRDKPDAWKRFGLPDGIQWTESAAQATIIRYLATEGLGDIECDNSDDDDDQERIDPYEVTGDQLGGLRDMGVPAAGVINIDGSESDSDGELDAHSQAQFQSTLEGIGEPEILPSYDPTEVLAVVSIMTKWLKSKFDVAGLVILCAECSRYMATNNNDGSVNLWAVKQMSRPRWFMHCGPCDDRYGVPRVEHCRPEFEDLGFESGREYGEFGVIDSDESDGYEGSDDYNFRF